jgi:hypothetical protein
VFVGDDLRVLTCAEHARHVRDPGTAPFEDGLPEGAACAATAAATGTPTSIARYPQTVGVTWDPKYGVPVSAAPASAGRTSSQNSVRFAA